MLARASANLIRMLSCGVEFQAFGRNALGTLLGTVAVLFLGFSECAVADEPIARFGEIHGVVSVQRAVAGRFVLAVRGAALSEGDVVVSEKDSLAQIVFSDGSQIALRPNSRLSITQYHYDKDQPREDHMLLDLLRGGLRTITGLVGKRGDMKAYSMRLGATATIGIRGTDFVARLCESDCATEQHALSQQRLPISEMPVVVARAAEITGHASAVSSGRPERALFLGAPLYNGDQVMVGHEGHVTVLFSDNTRIVLSYDSRFLITNYRYDKAQPQAGNFLVNLLRGSLRTVTGVIGHTNPAHVGYTTPTATVGIRGTAFDLRCVPLGQGKTAPANGPAVDCDQTVVVSMREGSTLITSGSNSLALSSGQSAVIDGPNSVPSLLDATPPSTSGDTNPLPEQLNLDFGQLFGAQQNDAQTGAYAAVFDGSISLSQNGKEIILGPGEAGFAPIPDQNNPALDLSPEQLLDVPPFIRGDSLLQNFDFDPMACVVQ
jgi:hypothetical protein